MLKRCIITFSVPLLIIFLCWNSCVCKHKSLNVHQNFLCQTEVLHFIPVLWKSPYFQEKNLPQDRVFKWFVSCDLRLNRVKGWHRLACSFFEEYFLQHNSTVPLTVVLLAKFRHYTLYVFALIGSLTQLFSYVLKTYRADHAREL